MTNQLPPSGYILTPQQQTLLFAALNSNKPQQSPHNSVLSLSPASLDQPSFQNPDPAPVQQDTSFLDYDLGSNPDSSYDFELTGFDTTVDDGQMFGDLPGTASSSKPGTPVSSELPEKRSHPEDGEDDESSPKRRESTEKVPKKPGRKPITSEPSSKRKAQNRAAQRAFRERKEKHLKDLETKVEELQKVSNSATSENEKLRLQVDKMTTELNEYKKRVSLLTNNRSLSSGSRFQWGNAAVKNLNDVNFNFEFPKFGGSLPGPPVGYNTSASAVSKDSQQASPKAFNVPTPASSLDAFGRPGYRSPADDFSVLDSILGLSTTNAVRHGNSFGSLDSTNLNFRATATSSPSASSASNAGPTSSCGTSPEPSTQSPTGFKCADNLTTIGEEKHSPANGSNTNQTQGNLSTGGFDWLSATNGNTSFNPQIFGGYREPQNNILSNGLGDPGFFDDAYDVDFLTPFNVAPPVVQPQKDILAEIDARKMDDSIPPAAMPPANFNGNLLTCNKIWEKLQNCSKVQNADVDLDSLCKDLKHKAKCTGSGPMVNEKDFREVVNKYVKPECADQALELVRKPQNP